MAFLWSVVLFLGIAMMVLGPVLLVTKQMVLIGTALGVFGTMMAFRGLLAIGGRAQGRERRECFPETPGAQRLRASRNPKSL